MSFEAVVIGVGNPFRRDDGVGHSIVELLERRRPPGVMLAALDGEPARIVEAWSGARLAVVVDAVRTDAPPGTIHRFEVGTAALPVWSPVGGSHALGVEAAVDLGRVLRRLPERLVLYGIEGSDFGAGPGLSAPVQRATAALADRLTAELLAEPEATA